jgi:hypothetical protein
MPKSYSRRHRRSHKNASRSRKHRRSMKGGEHHMSVSAPAPEQSGGKRHRRSRKQRRSRRARR